MTSPNDLDALPEPGDLGELLLGLLERPRPPGAAALTLPVEVPAEAFDAFRGTGEVVALLGTLGGDARGSEYLAAAHGLSGPRPPLDPARERAVQRAVLRAMNDGLLTSARACGRGGLAVALARSCAEGGIGAALRIPFPARKDLVLFAEEPSRFVVSLPRERLDHLSVIARLADAPLVVLGATGGEVLEVQSALSVPVAALARAAQAGYDSTS